MISETSRSVLRAYSNPFEPFDAAIGEAWLVKDVRERCAIYCDAVGERTDVDRGLVDVLESSSPYFSGFDQVWYPSLGALRSVPEDAAAAAKHLVELALRLHEIGAPGEWSARVPAGSCFVFDRWLLRDCTELRVRATGERVEVHGRASAGPIERRWVKERGEWREERAVPAAAQPIGAGILVLPWPFRKDDDQQDCDHPLVDFSWRCGEALRQLEAASPTYANWVTRATRIVMPLTPRDNHVASWSSRDYPSLLAMDANGLITDVSETFVHESSHQHCTMLQRFGRLFYPGPMPEAWSPVKRQVRPMYKILVSFHAFGNIVLFFRALRHAGQVDQTWYEANATRYEEWLSELGATLDRCDALTPIGECLWRPLAERVAQGAVHV